SQKKYQLEDQKDTLDDQQSALSDVSTVISDFISKIDELSSASSNHFNPMTSSSSNEEMVRVDSVSGLDQRNDYDISVARLASKDIILSNVLEGDAATLSEYGDGSVDITIGDKTVENISIATTKTDESGNIVNKTNEEILQSFSTTVSELLGAESDSDVFQIDNDGKVQLSIKSAETGYDERIQFSNA